MSQFVRSIVLSVAALMFVSCAAPSAPMSSDAVNMASTVTSPTVTASLTVVPSATVSAIPTAESTIVNLPSPTQTVSGTNTLSPPEISGEPSGSSGDSLLCLQVYGADLASASVELQGALVQVQQHPDWQTIIGEADDLAIAGECEVQLPNGLLNSQRPIGPGIVEMPGPWYAVVVVLDQAHANQVLGEADLSLVPYEMMITDDVAAATTSALVVREGVLHSTEGVRQLTLVLRLDPDKLPNSTP